MTVLFEDADIIVIDKPAGRIVHSAPGHEKGSLATIDYLKANPEVTQKIVDLIKTTPVNPALAKKK